MVAQLKRAGTTASKHVANGDISQTGSGSGYEELNHLDGFLGVFVDSCAVLATDCHDALEIFAMIVICFSVELGQHDHQVDSGERRPHI